jgi:hypothetical protein
MLSERRAVSGTQLIFPSFLEYLRYGHGRPNGARRSLATRASRAVSQFADPRASTKDSAQTIMRQLRRWEKNRENDQVMARERQRDAIAAHAAHAKIEVGGLHIDPLALDGQGRDDAAVDLSDVPEVAGAIEVGDLVVIGFV